MLSECQKKPLRSASASRYSVLASAIILCLVATQEVIAAPDACYQASFIASKLGLAAVRCNFPDSEEVRKPLALFYDVAKHACGPGVPSKWPGSSAAVTALNNEMESQGRGTVCGRIYGEFLNMTPGSGPPQSSSAACQRFPNLC